MSLELDQFQGAKVNQLCKLRLANRSVLRFLVPVDRQTCESIVATGSLVKEQD